MKRLSDTEFKKLLLSELKKTESKAHSKTNFFELLRTKYSIHKGRALELHDKFYSEWAQLREQGLNKGIEQSGIDDAKKGIKTKQERMLYLQQAVEEMKAQLSGMVKFTFMVGNAIKHSHTGDFFMLPIEKQLDIRAKIKEYTAELNKMGGDYAAQKLETTINAKPESYTLPDGTVIKF